jgi:hypothetical protein
VGEERISRAEGLARKKFRGEGLARSAKKIAAPRIESARQAKRFFSNRFYGAPPSGSGAL